MSMKFAFDTPVHFSRLAIHTTTTKD